MMPPKKKPRTARRNKKPGRASRQASTGNVIPTSQAVTAPATTERAGTARSDSGGRLREKLHKFLDLDPNDPEKAKRFARKLKTLAEQICSLHLQHSALFEFKWEYPGPSEDTYFSAEFDAAEAAFGALEREVQSTILRQRALVADLELRATLLQATLGFGGAVVPRG